MQYFSYGYDTTKGKCVQFMYGGCQGNKNNFESMENCEKECEGKGPMSDESKTIKISRKVKRQAPPRRKRRKPRPGNPKDVPSDPVPEKVLVFTPTPKIVPGSQSNRKNNRKRPGKVSNNGDPPMQSSENGPHSNRKNNGKGPAAGFHQRQAFPTIVEEWTTL
ncbi:Kunitz/Bovine pancreatic trypsin inhibitor domain protein [Ancylostoma ceylanicum]|uniref:Kunitz/Bovine pancreatic trypsin inhibitor domain protein n=1 Tax=Ancylostoma ceylanicum TaxID=53326 RepID=A0A0D6LUE5_9BILA|nr:Kunitz/Bovine pancreatic trypsin inhibitor domain protein [Ancylostoma ceylanicum]